MTMARFYLSVHLLTYAGHSVLSKYFPKLCSDIMVHGLTSVFDFEICYYWIEFEWYFDRVWSLWEEIRVRKLIQSISVRIWSLARRTVSSKWTRSSVFFLTVQHSIFNNQGWLKEIQRSDLVFSSCHHVNLHLSCVEFHKSEFLQGGLFYHPCVEICVCFYLFLSWRHCMLFCT